MLTTCLHCHNTAHCCHYLLPVVTRGHVAWWTSPRNEAEECVGFRAHPHLGIEKGGSTAVMKSLYSLFHLLVLLFTGFQGAHCCFGSLQVMDFNSQSLKVLH